MPFLRKTTQAATLLLVFLMSTMLALPPGMDLEFCFGKDGHIDVSLNGCQDGASPKVPAQEWPSVYNTSHHGDCLDVAVTCSATQQPVRADGKSNAFSHSSISKNDLSSLSLFFHAFLAASADACLGPKACQVFPENILSSRLIFLRTVVLLI